MREGSMLMAWYRAEFGDHTQRIRAVEDLLEAGHNGLAEGVVVRALKARYKQDVAKDLTRMKVNDGSQVYYL